MIIFFSLELINLNLRATPIPESYLFYHFDSIHKHKFCDHFSYLTHLQLREYSHFS